MRLQFLLVILFISSCTLHATPVKVIVLGDSYSDDGINLPYDEHGFNRESNGFVWPEYLMQRLNLSRCSLRNYAYSGAYSGEGNYYNEDWSGIAWQAKQLLLQFDEERAIFDEKRFIIFEAGGLNDVFEGIDNSNAAVKNNIETIETLLKVSQKILVLGLIDLSRAPYLNGDDKMRQNVQDFIQKINVQLKTMVKEKYGADTINRVVYVDINEKLWPQTNCMQSTKPMEILVKNGRNYTFAEVGNYIWHDDFHPTTKVHKIIADLIMDRLILLDFV